MTAGNATHPGSGGGRGGRGARAAPDPFPAAEGNTVISLKVRILKKMNFQVEGDVFIYVLG